MEEGRARVSLDDLFGSLKGGPVLRHDDSEKFGQNEGQFYQQANQQQQQQQAYQKEDQREEHTPVLAPAQGLMCSRNFWKKKKKRFFSNMFCSPKRSHLPGFAFRRSVGSSWRSRCNHGSYQFAL
jgi:hypothetical protein